jgi:hypothetical protein
MTNRTPDPMDTELEILFPGRTIEIEGESDRTMKVRIKPMPIRHFRDFKKAIHSAIDRLSSSGMLDEEGISWSKDFIPVVIDLATDELLDMVNECCEGINLLADNCPNWVFPLVAKEWIFESFGSEKKIRPWVQLIEETLEKATGQKPQLWEALSRISSEVDGESETSEISQSVSSTG